MSNRNESATNASSADVEEGLLPVDGKWFKVGFYLALIALALYWFVTAFEFDTLEDNAMPWLASGTIIGLGIVQLIRVFSPETIDRLTPGDDLDEEPSGMQARLKEARSSDAARPLREQHVFEIYMIAWMVILPLAMYFVGFVLVMPVWVFGFVWFFRDLRDAAIVTVIFTVFVFGLFFYLLDLRPWPGILIPELVQQLTDLLPGL